MLRDKLISLRNKQGLTQEAVAEHINVSRQAYAKWENGSTVPGIDKCIKLAQLFQVSIDELVSEDKTDCTEPEVFKSRGRDIWGSVNINERGQIVIPKALRTKFGIHSGERLVVLSDDKLGIAIVPKELFDKQLQSIADCATCQAEDEPFEY